MSKALSLQDPFLNSLRKERVPVAIYLVNGIKLQGQVESFDQFVVLLKNTVSQMVYKHAISTIVPARNVKMQPFPGPGVSGPLPNEGVSSHRSADLPGDDLDGEIDEDMQESSHGNY